MYDHDKIFKLISDYDKKGYLTFVILAVLVFIVYLIMNRA